MIQKRIVPLSFIMFLIAFYFIPSGFALDQSVDTIHARGLWTAEWVDAQGNVHYGVTGKGVRVAVVDSGIDATHKDLDEGHVVYNAKYTGVWVEAPNTDTTSGHGTHCAGIIGGTGERSNARYRGVAWGSDIIGLGCGDLFLAQFASTGLQWVKSNAQKYNIKVVSCSWGPSGGSAPSTDPIFEWFNDNGIVVVFSAGNNGGDGSTSKTSGYATNQYNIGVAACEKNGRTIADFSSRGAKSDPSTWPDITAPGVDIWSAAATTGIYMNLFQEAQAILNGYVQASGTSMACPHVSGVVALMFEINPNLTPAQIREIIYKTADKNFGTYEESGYKAGHGLINAQRAVAAAHYLLLQPSASVDQAVSLSRIGEKDGRLILNPGTTYTQNTPPLASFVYQPSNPTVEDTISFTDTSMDPDGTIVSWSWDFGDGSSSSVQNPKHVFSSPGNYIVKLTVSDEQGASSSAAKTIRVYDKGSDRPPSKVTGLKASVSGPNVYLSWNTPDDNGNPIIKYHVYRSQNISAAKALIGESTKNSYLDKNVEKGRTYYYWVSAINSVGEGDVSEYASITTPSSEEVSSGKNFIPGFELLVFIFGLIMALLHQRR